MYQKIEKMKQHIQENKKVYIAAAGGMVVGGIGVCIGVRQVNPKQITNIKQGIAVNSPNTVHQMMINQLQRRGHPGNVILWIEKDLYCESQNRMASTAGLDAGMLSKHLNGKIDNVNGNHFIKVGEATL